MSRPITVELYDAVVELKTEWHFDDDYKGAIKVVMTRQSSDPENKQQLRQISEEKQTGVSPLTTNMDRGGSVVSTLCFDFPGISYSVMDFTIPPIADDNGEAVSESYEYRIKLVDESED